MVKGIPDWAKKKACDLVNAESSKSESEWHLRDVEIFQSVRALAKYIADNEKEPVASITLKAREIAAKYFRDNAYPETAVSHIAGHLDDSAVCEVIVRTLMEFRKLLETINVEARDIGPDGDVLLESHIFNLVTEKLKEIEGPQ